MTRHDTDAETSEGCVASFVEYGTDDEPPAGETVPLGVQRLLAMLLSTAALPREYFFK